MGHRLPPTAIDALLIEKITATKKCRSRIASAGQGCSLPFGSFHFRGVDILGRLGRGGAGAAFAVDVGAGDDHRAGGVFFDQPLELDRVDDFLLDELATDGLQRGAAAFEDVPCALQAFVENAFDFLVDFAGRLLAVVLRARHLQRRDEERIAVRVAEVDRGPAGSCRNP